MKKNILIFSIIYFLMNCFSKAEFHDSRNRVAPIKARAPVPKVPENVGFSGKVEKRDVNGIVQYWLTTPSGTLHELDVSAFNSPIVLDGPVDINGEKKNGKIKVLEMTEISGVVPEKMNIVFKFKKEESAQMRKNIAALTKDLEKGSQFRKVQVADIPSSIQESDYELSQISFHTDLSEKRVNMLLSQSEWTKGKMKVEREVESGKPPSP